MDTPFYRIHRNNYPFHPRYYYNNPPPEDTKFTLQRKTTPVPQKKVISIPVHYVGADHSRSDSAIKIQKVFRGFLVRKSMKKIAEIRKEVNEMEKKVSKEETIESIKRDSKEKLKVNETLMSLLFELDSVRGVDSGVRDARKAVIKKAIAIQEFVDSVVESNDVEVGTSIVDCNDQTEGFVRADGDENTDKTLGMGGNSDSIKIAVDQMVELRNCDETVEPECGGGGGVNEADTRDESEKSEEKGLSDMVFKDWETVEVNEEVGVDGVDENVDKQVVEDDDGLAVSVGECEESVGTSQTESHTDSSANPQSLIEEDDEANDDDDMLLGGNDNDVEIHGCEEKEGDFEVDAGDLGKNDDDVEIGELDQTTEGNEGQKCCNEGKTENKKSKELLEKMMKENEKMMGLMAELSERNEMQTRLLSCLSQRVEQLEMAFLCDKLRKKKKRNAAGLVDCLESTQDNRKCGKR